MRINNKILKPIITEKSMSLARQGRFVFQVSMNSTKNSVAKDLKDLYGVDAVEVNSMISHGKKRRITKTRLHTKPAKLKKVIVLLKPGQKIDYFIKE